MKMVKERNVISILILATLLLIFAGCKVAEPISDGDRTIYFGTWLDGDPYVNIYAITPEGRGAKEIIEDGLYPRLSTDLTKIVYSTDSDGDYEIWIANADGTSKQKLTDNESEDNRPFFSPDGTTILFESDRDGTTRLYTMDINGENIFNLTPGIMALRGEYSPNGDRITFTSPNGSTNGNKIQIMDSDGQNIQTILPSDFYHSWGSHWSPDGTKLAFTAFLGDGTDPYNAIYTVKDDGTGLSELYSGGHASQNPYWSPDGSELVFIHIAAGTGLKQLYLISSDGSGIRQLLSSNLSCFQPYWIW